MANRVMGATEGGTPAADGKAAAPPVDAAPVSGEPRIDRAQLTARLDALLGDAVSRGEVPGIVAVVTDRDASVYAGAHGERVLGSRDPIAPETICWLASMTKPLTSVAVLQLVERGVLALDEPAQRWLPALAQAAVLQGFDSAGLPVLRAPRTSITLRHLLTHTAGFGYGFWNAELRRYRAARKRSGDAAAAREGPAEPLLFDPGTHWQYGTGLDWAGRIVEAASGMRLGAYLRAQVFHPLGMHDTAFRVEPAGRARLSAQHQRTPAGTLAVLDTPPPDESSPDSGGGGLYGTAVDYARFIRCLLNRGGHDAGRLLQPHSVELMASNQIGALRVAPLRTAMPESTNDVELFPGLPKAWSLACQINLEPASTGLPARSMMWAGLANTYFWIDPHNGIGGVYLSQLFPFADQASLSLFYEFQRRVYAGLAPGGDRSGHAGPVPAAPTGPIADTC
jgi:CubicO group peptidase (beta-lactamase class C family)